MIVKKKYNHGVVGSIMATQTAALTPANDTASSMTTPERSRCYYQQHDDVAGSKSPRSKLGLVLRYISSLWQRYDVFGVLVLLPTSS